MEREVLWTGIGGQGVQLAARILALAAMADGREVMSLGTYGGTMRGGNTDATVVIADGPIASPPIVAWGWAALVVHPKFFAPTRARLDPGSLVVVDAAAAAEPLDAAGASVFPVPASEVAKASGSRQTTALALLGAFAGLTGIVSLASLVSAMEESLPPYRREHVASNEAALSRGFEALPRDARPAWVAEEVA